MKTGFGDAGARGPSAGNGRPEGTRRARWADRLRSSTSLPVFGVILASAVPRLLTAGHFIHYDEPKWARRSLHFSDAVLSGDFAGATSAAVPGSSAGSTMPGVTTMWIGSAARGVWAAGRSMGIWPDEGLAFPASIDGLYVAQGVHAVGVSVLIGVVTFLLARWVGTVAAVIAGVLLATEPFLVANGALLHTDELVTLFGIGSLVATALVLGLPHVTPWSGRWWAALLAGALAGACLLTKLSALAMLVAAPAMAVAAVVRARRAREGNGPPGGDGPLAQRSVLRVASWWAAGAVAVVFVAYPALWVAPLQELENLWTSAQLATGGHRQYFLGERTRNPGPLYLFVTLPLRTTPWFLVAGSLAAVLIWRRSTRAFGFLLLAMALPTFVVVSLASKQMVRYGLPVLAVGALAVGLVVSYLVQDFVRSPRSRRFARATGVAGAILVTVHTITVTPWVPTYFNPVLGGGKVAEQAHVLGAGEGLPEAGRFIRERAGDRCDEISIWTYPVDEGFPCGDVFRSRDPERYRTADYVALYVNQRQRMDPDLIEDVLRGRELLEEVTIRGIDMVRIYGPAAGAGQERRALGAVGPGYSVVE